MANCHAIPTPYRPHRLCIFAMMCKLLAFSPEKRRAGRPRNNQTRRATAKIWKPNEFKLAINMAGAVSAGAYTAGVLDFLTEATEEWETRKGALRAYLANPAGPVPERRKHQARSLAPFAAFRSREIHVPPCRSAAFRIEAGSSRRLLTQHPLCWRTAIGRSLINFPSFLIRISLY
jgi:hypothetical protein